MRRAREIYTQREREREEIMCEMTRRGHLKKETGWITDTAAISNTKVSSRNTARHSCVVSASLCHTISTHGRPEKWAMVQLSEQKEQSKSIE